MLIPVVGLVLNLYRRKEVADFIPPFSKLINHQNVQLLDSEINKAISNL
jgi:hypothetical protein